METFNTPHFKAPFRIIGASAEYVEQGSDDELVQNCATILQVPYGSREDEPDFGTPQQEFNENGADLNTLQSALLRDEPRAETLTTEQLEDLASTVGVEVV